MIQRLPFYYNFNHMFFYEQRSFSLYRCGQLTNNFEYPVYSMSYRMEVRLVLKQFFFFLSKPWVWYSVGYHFKLYWLVHNFRATLNETKPTLLVPFLVTLISISFIYFYKKKILQVLYIILHKVLKRSTLQSLPIVITAQIQMPLSLLISTLLFAFNICLSFLITPATYTPGHGWFRFIYYQQIFLYVECSVIHSTRLKLLSFPMYTDYIKTYQFLSLLVVASNIFLFDQ